MVILEAMAAALSKCQSTLCVLDEENVGRAVVFIAGASSPEPLMSVSSPPSERFRLANGSRLHLASVMDTAAWAASV